MNSKKTKSMISLLISTLLSQSLIWTPKAFALDFEAELAKQESLGLGISRTLGTPKYEIDYEQIELKSLQIERTQNMAKDNESRLQESAQTQKVADIDRNKVELGH